MTLQAVIGASLVVSCAVALGACAKTNEAQESPTTSSVETTSSAPAVGLPSAAQLNQIVAVASDPASPIAAKVAVVQGAEAAPEVFGKLIALQEASGAKFIVEDPVRPGNVANSALATVKLTRPERRDQMIEKVEFVNENGMWKLSLSWGCRLVETALPAPDVPAVCTAQSAGMETASGAFPLEQLPDGQLVGQNGAGGEGGAAPAGTAVTNSAQTSAPALAPAESPSTGTASTP